MLLQINSVIKSDWVIVEYDQGVRASQVAETVKRASEPSRNLLERTPSTSPSVHRKNTPKCSPEHSPSSLHSSAYLVKARTASSSQPSRIPRPSRAPSVGTRDARLSNTMQTSPSSDTSNALREEPQISTHDAKVWTEDEIHHLHNVSKQNVAGLRRTMRSSQRKTAAKIREFESPPRPGHCKVPAERPDESIQVLPGAK
ncbi:hypothetical protein GQ607_015913 [Colletotrichum asianum]|uniref:Uncharacterized protein n=1 Tax=Colletotrichum asianum TaxID=702518 RepID=A0A8H3ZEP3_9PEZI|nr:hypothetical protein GQ607_015913 [Colletotrichum asianum]